jgi:hypothetical protein
LPATFNFKDPAGKVLSAVPLDSNNQAVYTKTLTANDVGQGPVRAYFTGDSTYKAGSSDSFVTHTSDINGHNATAGISPTVTQIVAGPGIYISAPNGQGIVTVSTQPLPTTLTTESLWDICWTKTTNPVRGIVGQFTAVGNNGVNLRSRDGVNWIELQPNITPEASGGGGVTNIYGVSAEIDTSIPGGLEINGVGGYGTSIYGQLGSNGDSVYQVSTLSDQNGTIVAGFNSTTIIPYQGGNLYLSNGAEFVGTGTTQITQIYNGKPNPVTGSGTLYSETITGNTPSAVGLDWILEFAHNATTSSTSFIVLGAENTGKIFKSNRTGNANGTWSVVYTDSNNINGISYGNNVWVAVGGNNTVYTSSNTTSWVKRKGALPGATWLHIVYGNGTFVAVGSRIVNEVIQGATMYSNDGITWTKGVSSPAKPLNSIAYSPELNLFVAVGDGGTIVSAFNDPVNGIDLQPVSQNGVTPPTEYKTLQSSLALMISSTSTVKGQPLILKAVSNAAMFKTVPAEFYYTSTSSTLTNFIGTATFDTNVAAFVSTDLPTGINQIWTTWPGENRYAGQTTQAAPITVNVAPGYPLGGTFTLTANPTSGLVTEEGQVVFTANLNTSTSVTGNILFYEDHRYLGSGVLNHNVATLTLPSIDAGVHTITATWPGNVIGGLTYEGKSVDLTYTVLSGSTLSTPLILTVSPNHGVLNEGTLTFTATISTSTVLNGNIEFFSSSTSLGSVNLVNNQATLSVSNIFAVGTYTFTAVWDGNSLSHPRYIPTTSNTTTWSVYERETISSMTLTVSPNPSVYQYDQTSARVIMNTPFNISGSIDFYDGVTLIGSSPILNNQAYLNFPALSTGTHILHAYYGGSGISPKYFPVTSNTVSNTVTTAYPYSGSLALTSSLNPVNQLSSGTLVAKLSIGNTFTGYVSFIDTAKLTVTTTSTQTITHVRKILDFGWTVPFYYLYGTYVQSWIKVSDTIGYKVGDLVTLDYYPNITILGAPGPDLNYINSHYGFSGMHTTYKILSINSSTGIITFDGGTSPYPGPYNSRQFSTLDRFGNTVTIFSNEVQSGNTDLIWELSGIGYYGNTAWLAQGGYFSLPNGTLSPYDYADGFGLTTYVENKVISANSTVTSTSTIGIVNINTNTAAFVFDPNTLPLGITASHNIKAVWSGGRKDGVPYYGIESNTLTQTVTSASVVLSSVSTNPNSIKLASTLTAIASVSTVSPGTVTLYEGNTTISTATIVGNSATFYLNSGTLSIGAHNLNAVWNNKPVISNTLTETIINPTAVNIVPTFNANPYRIYTSSGTTNTSVLTLSVAVATSGTHRPTGSITVSDANSALVLGGPLVASNTQTSVAAFTWDPRQFNEVDSGIINLYISYPGDAWNTSSVYTAQLQVLRGLAFTGSFYGGDGVSYPTVLDITVNGYHNIGADFGVNADPDGYYRPLISTKFVVYKGGSGLSAPNNYITSTLTNVSITGTVSYYYWVDLTAYGYGPKTPIFLSTQPIVNNAVAPVRVTIPRVYDALYPQGNSGGAIKIFGIYSGDTKFEPYDQSSLGGQLALIGVN